MMECFSDAWKKIRLMISCFNFMQDLQVDTSQAIPLLTKLSRQNTIGLPYSELPIHLSENVSLAKSALAKLRNPLTPCIQ